MMKTLGLVLAMVLVMGAAAVADTATFDVYQGWNQISCPLVPMNLSTDPNVDPQNDYTEPYYGFSAIGDDLLNYKMSRYDATTGSTLTYLADDAFGKLLLGDGYSVYVTVPGTTTISYQGVPNGVPDAAGVKTDMWISLPGIQGDSNVPFGGGWHLIGTPYAEDVPAYKLDDLGNPIWQIFFTNGTEVKDWMAAVDAGWVGDTMYGLSGGIQSEVTFATDNYTLKAGCSYWIPTKMDNLAMIILAQN